MTVTETFQLSTDAAEVYEQRFVPALFAEWAGHLVDAASPAPGQDVVDVACGTGVVARAAAERLSGTARVVGVDVNEAMLAVARRIRPDIEWHRADAASLPFADGSFDVALCQAALMYFADPVEALREMARVVRADGTVAVQVWGDLASQPAYRVLTDVVARHAGPAGADLFDSYFSLGAPGLAADLLRRARLEVSRTRTRMGTVRFSSLSEFVAAEIDSTPLVERVDDAARQAIVDDAVEALASFAAPDGTTRIPIEGHLVVGRRP